MAEHSDVTEATRIRLTERLRLKPIGPQHAEDLWRLQLRTVRDERGGTIALRCAVDLTPAASRLLAFVNPVAAEVASARRALIDRAVGLLAGDPRVEALWLGGSSGRGEDDALSDVDLVVVFGADGQGLVTERMELAARVGPLVAHLDSPHNAPPDGAQLNALYDVQPLPILVDWNLWPTTPERPSDVIALFERDEGFRTSERSYEAIQGAQPRGRAPDRDAAWLDHFRFMMIPIAAKYAARGWNDAVVGMFGVMQEPIPDTTERAVVLEALRRLLERLAPDESPEAVASVRTYLDRVTSVLA